MGLGMTPFPFVCLLVLFCVQVAHGCTADGERGGKSRMGTSYYNYDACCSKKGVCGYCGEFAQPGKPCSKSVECGETGHCKGTVTKGCHGVCEVKIADGEECDMGHGMGADSSCLSGQCLVLHQTVAYCQPKGGSKEGQACTLDSHCSLDEGASGLWCKGGGALTRGTCAPCPDNCAPKEGCSACNNDENKMKCGRSSTSESLGCAVNTIAHQGTAFFECLKMPDTSKDEDCPGNDVGEQTKDCFGVEGQCDFHLGPNGVTLSTAFPVRNKLKMLDSEFADFNLDGLFELRGEVGVAANPLKMTSTFELTLEADTSVTLHVTAQGRLRVPAEGEFEHALGPKLTLFRQVFFVAGGVPVLLEMFMTPFFWGSLDIKGEFDAELTLHHRASATASVIFNAMDQHLEPHFDVDFAAPHLIPKINKGNLLISTRARVGPRLQLSFNRMMVGLDIAAAIHGEFALHVSMGGIRQLFRACFAGEASVSAGIDVRPVASFEVINPAQVAENTCNSMVDMALEKPPKKSVDCALSALSVGSLEFVKRAMHESCAIVRKRFAVVDLATYCVSSTHNLNGEWAHFPLLETELNFQLCVNATKSGFTVPTAAAELQSIQGQARCDGPGSLEQASYHNYGRKENGMQDLIDKYYEILLESHQERERASARTNNTAIRQHMQPHISRDELVVKLADELEYTLLSSGLL